MQIAVNGKQFDIGDSLRGHIDESIRQISEKYFSNPIDATVTMSREGGKVRADISVHVGRRILIQGQAQNADAYASFDSAAAKIDKRLRRFKRRLRDHDHQAPPVDGLEAQEVVFAAENEADDRGIRGHAHGTVRGPGLDVSECRAWRIERGVPPIGRQYRLDRPQKHQLNSGHASASR
jgi:ribosomal subunit interface protein